MNWRPLFFAKFFQLVENASSTVEAMSYLVAPNVIKIGQKCGKLTPALLIKMITPLNGVAPLPPPVINPFAFTAYGYASCSGWATFVTYVARSVGIPARQVGTPCWNAPLGGVDYRGLAKDNPNVSVCWHGGWVKKWWCWWQFLNNHNWVEYWDDEIRNGYFKTFRPKVPNRIPLVAITTKAGVRYDPNRLFSCRWTCGSSAS